MHASTPRALTAMSEEQLKGFLEAVAADAVLQSQLDAAADADSVMAIAKAAGFVICAEELQVAQLDVSENELESVAGGLGARCLGSYYTKIAFICN